MKQSDERFLKGQVSGTYDSLLLPMEYYNPNRFPVTFERDNRYLFYIVESRKAVGPVKGVIQPKERVTLPHRYWTFFSPEPLFDLIQIFGKDMGKGMRKPSLPVYDKGWVKED